MTGIIDYGMGNLASVQNALDRIGQEHLVSADPAVLETCSHLILPGVGSIKDCMEALDATGLSDWIRTRVMEKGIPILGICLGMQAFFSSSEENGGVPCLGLIPGRVVKMTDPAVRIPHIGWNALETEVGSFHVYYDHSFYATEVPEAYVTGTSGHGSHKIVGMVKKGNITACQFHPEKSGEAGLALLEAFGKEKTS